MQRNRYVSPGKSFNLARSSVGDEAKTTDEGWVLEVGEPLHASAGLLDLGLWNNWSSNLLRSREPGSPRALHGTP